MSENSSINFYENIKVFVVILSGVVFVVNLWSGHHINDVAALTWVYIPSAALSLYGMTSISRDSVKWQSRIFWLLITTLGVVTVSMVISSKYSKMSVIILLMIKIFNTIVVIGNIIYTVSQNQKHDNPKEMQVREYARHALDQENIATKFRQRSKKKQYRHYIRSFKHKQ